MHILSPRPTPISSRKCYVDVYRVHVKGETAHASGLIAIGKLSVSITEVPECRVFQMLASRISSFFD